MMKVRLFTISSKNCVYEVYSEKTIDKDCADLSCCDFDAGSFAGAFDAKIHDGYY